MGSAAAIEEAFREHFRSWGLSLPAADVAARAGGHLFVQGWHVGYAWGEEQGEEFLEVLAQHRMTNDRRFRIFASGRTEHLDAPSTMYAFAADATEEERLEAAAASRERNLRLYSELRERGLLPPPGGNLLAHEIAEYLGTGGEVEAGDDA